MWFWLSLAALLCWSGSDLFSKIGCADARDPFSHLKMVTAVGLVMGLHAAWEIFVQGVEISWSILLTYLPVSALYILSMAIGYFGLRYIELSISSPICNSSGAVVAILCLAINGYDSISLLQGIATLLVCGGVIALGIVEAREDETLREMRQLPGSYHYTKSAIALILPVVYCLLDALGTFSDSLVLETLDEDSANVAYELTFLTVGVIALAYTLLRRKTKFTLKQEIPKYIGAAFETGGQFAYIYAISDSAHVALSAPVISSYCAVSVLWSRLFLKEKLSRKHYLALAFIVAGIALLGLADP